MDQDFIIHINRQERTQAMEGVEQAVSQVYDNKEQPKEKLAAGVFSYESRAAVNHLSVEQAREWLTANAGPQSRVIWLHQHQVRK